MTVFVDEELSYGWVLRGRTTKSCHMFSNRTDNEELHAVAAAIGMKRSWFQDDPRLPHYDLTPSRRAAAIAKGAVSVTRHMTSAVMYFRREKLL